MQVDQVINLANNQKYLLLLESELTEERYFLAVLLDANDEPTEQYAALKEIIKDGEVYSQKINNPVILNGLIEDYRLQYQEEYEN